jgi:peptidylprolyl isomerase
MTRRILAVTTAALVGGLLLTACGAQTDARVATSDAAASTAASVPASAAPSAAASTAAPSTAASTAPSTAPSLPPYAAFDCTTGAGTAADAAPTDATAIGDVYAALQSSGAPVITVATNAAPATELGVADLKVGTGPAAQPGDTLTVNYCGVGLTGLSVFDSSWARGTPATFPLTGVIPGWQQGVPGMKVGGTRLLVIPGALGYGEQGTQGIAPNETLVFVVQLESIGK